MLTTSRRSPDCRNAILAMLPEEEYQSLSPHLELVPTPFEMVVYERDKPIEYAYFPCSGEHSILAFMENGAAVEVGTVGYEGFSTIDLLLGSDIATETTICQIPGESLCLLAVVFKKAVNSDTALRRIALRYLQAYLSQVSQSVACNRLHTLDQRFARWVLMSHDRIEGDEFKLTQEKQTEKQSVHRPSVSVVAKNFQQAGLIRYARGSMTILDRFGLVFVCCVCFRSVFFLFVRLIGKSMS